MLKNMKEKENRKLIQWLMVPLLPAVIVGGYFWPYLGYIAIAAMVVMLILATVRGRFYCGWFCAMGAFHERLLAKVSRKKNIPSVFKKSWFKWLIFSLMMGLMVSRLIMSGGDPEKIGAVFVMMWTISTGFALMIGFFWKPRSWCRVCPMAAIQGLMSPRTYLLTVSDNCRECGLCQKVCPIETYPGANKEQGYVKSADCMRCSNCVVNCPSNALSLQAVPFSKKIGSTSPPNMEVGPSFEM